MAFVPDELHRIAERVKAGHPASASPRELLSWFNAHRRRYWVIRSVRAALDELDLDTTPSFEDAYFDGLLFFEKKTSAAVTPVVQAPTSGPDSTSTTATASTAVAPSDEDVQVVDPTH